MIDYYAKYHNVDSNYAHYKLLGNMKTLIDKNKDLPQSQKNKLIQVYRFVENPNEIAFVTTADNNLSFSDIYKNLDFNGIVPLVLSISAMDIDIPSN